MKSELESLFSNKLSAFLQSHSNISRIFVALSGGVDSLVLLHLIHRFLKSSTRDFSLHAIHVNHGLSDNADRWQVFCEKECEKLGITFHAEKVDLNQPDSGQSIESRARGLRYQVFNLHCKKNDLLLMAHHRDDQVETFFFRLFRGNGGKALSGIPESRPMGQALLFRPLLTVEKLQLSLWANDQGLEWVEDESNEDTYYSRNFIRQQLLPQIKERWPKLNNSVSRVIDLQAEQGLLLKELAQIDFKTVTCRDEFLRHWGECLVLNELKKLDSARQKNLLRLWMEKLAITMPSQERLEHLISLIGGEIPDTGNLLSWRDGDVEISWKVFENHLYLLSDSPAIDNGLEPKQWLLRQQACFQVGKFVYCCEEVTGTENLLDSDYCELTVLYREGGERCQPVSRDKSQVLKKLYQEYRVPPWERDAIPLFYINGADGDELVAVGDLWVCKGYESVSGKGWRIWREASQGSNR